MGIRNNPQTPIRATRNSFRILETLRDRGRAGITELADQLEMSKSTVHEHLVTLRELGYVTVEDGEYALCTTLLTFGGSARQKEALFEFAKDEIDELARETGKTAKVVTEEYGRGVYLYQSHGKEGVRTDAHVGTVVYLHATGVGKALLAHLPEERIEEIIETHGLPKRTENTITDEDELYAELETIRERGVAFDNEERIDGIRCVAAPIQRDGEVLGALSISGPKRRIPDERFRNEYPDLIRETARVIEINTTYTMRSP